MAEVRAHPGTPTAAQFYGLGAPSVCPPVVVNSTTGCIYTLTAAGTVVEVCGVSTIAAILMESGVSTKISAMAAAGALTGAELVPLVQAGVNVKATVLAIAALATATPAPPDTSVQFNNAGVFGGSANLVFVSPTTTAHTLTVSTGLLTVTPGNITAGSTNNMNLQTAGGTITGQRINHVASAVNFSSVYPATSAAPNVFASSAEGTSTNISNWIQAKGSGSVMLATGASLQQFEARASSAQSSAADILSAAGGNQNAFLTAQGGNGSAGSSIISVNFTAKGSAVFNYWKTTPLSGQPVARIDCPAGTPAVFAAISGNSGNPVQIAAAGAISPANLRIASTPGGAAGGFVEIAAVSATQAALKVLCTTAGGAVAPNNGLEILPTLGTTAVEFRVVGTGGTVPLLIKTLGAAPHQFDPSTGTTTTLETTVGTTLTLFNTVSTTVNAFGSGTAVTMGSTTGTMTLRNPTIVGSATTQALLDTVATTVNAFGSGTAVNIGASTGTATINNGIISFPNGTINAAGTGDQTFAGTMKFGTHSAIGAETVTGYITIKDSGGTSRKLAVVS